MPNHPVPIERKRARGNPGKRAMPKSDQVEVIEPLTDEAPVRLNNAGAELWHKMNSHAHWLGESDNPAMLMLCEKYDRREMLLAQLENEPLVLVPENGSRAQPNPLVAMVDQVEKDIVTLLSLLGMTPTDRSRLGLAEVKKQSTLEKLRSQREAR